MLVGDKQQIVNLLVADGEVRDVLDHKSHNYAARFETKLICPIEGSKPNTAGTLLELVAIDFCRRPTNFLSQIVLGIAKLHELGHFWQAGCERYSVVHTQVPQLSIFRGHRLRGGLSIHNSHVKIAGILKNPSIKLL